MYWVYSVWVEFSSELAIIHGFKLLHSDQKLSFQVWNCIKEKKIFRNVRNVLNLLLKIELEITFWVSEPLKNHPK